MPIPLRRFYAQKLIDAKNKESEEIKKATQSNQGSTQPFNTQKS